MNFRKIAMIAAAGIIILLLSLTACNGTTTTPPPSTTPVPTTTPTGPGGAIINSDSIVTAKINAIRPQTTGYPWELDVLIQTSLNVGDLPNPVADKVGFVVTLKTDVDMTSYKAGDQISARVKYTGDVPKPGITLYMYDITKVAATSAPGY